MRTTRTDTERASGYPRETLAGVNREVTIVRAGVLGKAPPPGARWLVAAATGTTNARNSVGSDPCRRPGGQRKVHPACTRRRSLVGTRGVVSHGLRGPADEDAFVTHVQWALSRALQETLPDCATLDELLRTIDEWRDRPITLIIDDLQEVGGSSAERALERFLTLRPPSISVLLGSRRLPDLNTSRLLVSGGLTELDGDDLRFRTWEVKELFRTVFAEPLTPEAAGPSRVALRAGRPHYSCFTWERRANRLPSGNALSPTSVAAREASAPI